jgi:hypothetical protein
MPIEKSLLLIIQFNLLPLEERINNSGQRIDEF